MSIPTVAVAIKWPPADVAELKKLADARGFDSVSEYVRHLVSVDREELERQYRALQPIFAGTDLSRKGNGV